MIPPQKNNITKGKDKNDTIPALDSLIPDIT